MKTNFLYALTPEPKLHLLTHYSVILYLQFIQKENDSEFKNFPPSTLERLDRK